MLCFRLSTTLLLATVCALMAAVACKEKVVTCSSSGNVHRLSCEYGVIRVQSALYGRQDNTTCSEGRPATQLANTRCSQNGTLEALRNRCDGRKQCEENINTFRRNNPCPGIYKYLETNFVCFPAIHLTVCEGSEAHLFCGEGQVIFVYGAYYGRTDTSTCANGRPSRQLRNIACSRTVTDNVSRRCNGKNSCTINVMNNAAGFVRDPCGGIYKYLEASYVCDYPLVMPQSRPMH